MICSLINFIPLSRHRKAKDDMPGPRVGSVEVLSVNVSNPDTVANPRGLPLELRS